MELNQEQKLAVEATENNVLVIAPPGSGKTRVITERAAYLMEHEHVSAYEIVLVTFTRLAANEIRTRLIERVGNQAYHMTIGTFHAIALNLLHRFGDQIGFRKDNITVYGDFEEQFLLKETAKEMGIYNGKNWKIKKGDVDKVFEKYYQEGIEPDALNPVYDLFKSFMARCRENQSYTYGGLLTGMKLLIPLIHKYLNWKHLILDEAHDTDKLQWGLMEAIREYCGTSFFMVADIDQTLYSWRGAYPEYIMQHQDEYTLYKLNKNYRSRASIVEAANKLISHNQDRLPMEMVAARESDPLIADVRVHRNVDSERLVQMKTTSDFLLPNDSQPITILARNHALLEKLSMLLESAHIDHVYIGKDTALTNSEEFRRFHAFLKLIVNPFDNFAFLLIKDTIGLSAADYTEIRNNAAIAGQSHFQAYINNKWIYGDEKYYDEFFDKYTEPKDDIITVTTAMSYLNFPFDIDPIREFISKLDKSLDISDYLDWLATIDIQDEVKEDYEGLTLMTIHAAKGLEWDTVIIAGCNEELLPSKQAIRNDEIQSERRLCYVAMTRAKDNLILAVRPETTETNGKIYNNPISRFIAEAL
jgi:DNA helicase-2/ATP-dependent DNA helicase PcrA